MVGIVVVRTAIHYSRSSMLALNPMISLDFPFDGEQRGCFPASLPGGGSFLCPNGTCPFFRLPARGTGNDRLSAQKFLCYNKPARKGRTLKTV